MKLKLLRRLAAGLVLLGLLTLVLGGLLPPLFAPDTCSAEPPALPRDCGDRLLCIDDNQQALIRRLQIIRQARQELRITSYHLQDDESGRDILAALYDAADRGVRVKLLLDGFSALKTLPESRNLQTLAAHPNAELRIYNPISPLRPWAVNYRLHDKLLLCDDRLYLLGGRNLRNVSLGQYQQTFDRDRDILVYSPRGGSIREVSAYFDALWALPEVKPKAGRFYEDAARTLRAHADDLPRRFPEAFCGVSWPQETMPAAVTLLHNPIEAKNKPPVLWNQILQLMNAGKSCIVQTPYLICSKSMYQDLADLCQSGTDVKILLNSPETGANLPGIADYRGQKNRIRRTGVALYELTAPQSCHTKTVLIDERLSLVGSFNFDRRSAHLDTETMLLIDCPALNQALQQQAQAAMDSSLQYFPDGTQAEGSAYEARPLPPGRLLLQKILQLLVWPLRHLL